MFCQFLLYSKVNQLYVFKYPLFFVFPSNLGHHRALSRVPHAIQQVLISYLFYTQYQQCIYVNPNLPIHPTLPFTPWYPYICSLRLCLYFFFVNKIVYTNFFRFYIYALIYGICFSLSDLLHSLWQSLSPSMSLQMTQFCSFLWLSNVPLYICTIWYLSIPLLMDIQVVSMSWLL